uniref:DUF5641 domain-containing protein n=1 Tax=Parascaris univalens TaxID=6257 RepID=A0A915B5K6_PARUN
MKTNINGEKGMLQFITENDGRSRLIIVPWLECIEQLCAAAEKANEASIYQTVAEAPDSFLIVIEGKALEAVGGFTVASDNYEAVKTTLQQRFGRSELLLKSLYAELHDAATPTKDFEGCVVSVERILQQLEQQGENINNSQTELCIEKRLPRWALLELEQAKEADAAWSVRKLRDKLQANSAHQGEYASGDYRETDYHLRRKTTEIREEMQDNIYVDNVFLTAHEIPAAIEKGQEAERVFEEADMNLRESRSNNRESRTLRELVLMSKSRVAPIRGITIPRLELMAALIGSRLLNFVKGQLKRTGPTFLWSDSQATLHWIATATTVDRFVGNRLAEIRRSRYVDSGNNPADLATRGLTIAELRQCSQWPVDFLRPQAIIAAQGPSPEHDKGLQHTADRRDKLLGPWKATISSLERFWKNWTHDYLMSLMR